MIRIDFTYHRFLSGVVVQHFLYVWTLLCVSSLALSESEIRDDILTVFALWFDL